MPMKPYFRTTLGGYTYKPWGFGTTEYSDVAESTNKTLGSILSNVGDKKRPLAQAYTVSLNINWTGSLYADIPSSNPSPWSRQNGVVNISVPSIASPTFSTLAYNEAVSKIYDLIRGSLDLSVDAGQIRQTKSLVSQTIKGMTQLSSVITSMRRNPAKASKIWLAYVYGWKPLSQSIYQTLDQLLKPDVTYIKAVGRGKELAYDNRETPGYNNIPYRYDLILSKRCVMEVRYKLSNSSLQSLAGYTSLNPVSIAWELTPYSFVVDWFVDIGGYIRNLESAIVYGQSFKSGYYTQTSLITGEVLCKGTGMSGTLRTIADLKFGHRAARKQRATLGGPPMPRAPVVHFDMGLGKLANASALLLSKLK